MNWDRKCLLLFTCLTPLCCLHTLFFLMCFFTLIVSWLNFCSKEFHTAKILGWLSHASGERLTSCHCADSCLALALNAPPLTAWLLLMTGGCAMLTSLWEQRKGQFWADARFDCSIMRANYSNKRLWDSEIRRKKITNTIKVSEVLKENWKY